MRQFFTVSRNEIARDQEPRPLLRAGDLSHASRAKCSPLRTRAHADKNHFQAGFRVTRPVRWEKLFFSTP